MGNRGQVKIIENGQSVFLYTHCGATQLVKDVRDALAKKERWNDAEYLARIIFDQMKHGDEGTTGFGIGVSEHGDIWRLVIVDVDNNIVEVIDNNEEKLQETFDDFIHKDLSA